MSARRSKASRRPTVNEPPINPIRGLGLTWVDRGSPYWRRRIALAVLYFLVLLLMTFTSGALTSGLVQASGDSELVHIGIISTVTCTIVISAFWSWRSTVRRERGLKKPASAESRRWSTGIAVTAVAVSRALVKTVVGALLIVLCVFVGTGVAFSGFALSLRKEYFGEAKERRRLEQWRSRTS